MRKFTHKVLGLVALVAAGSAVAIPASPVSAEPGYIRQAARTFSITNPAYNPNDPNLRCTGTAWIGINDSGYVSSSGSMTCPAFLRDGYKTITTYLGRDSGYFGTIAERTYRCWGCDYASVSVSAGRATVGWRYCNFVYAQVAFWGQSGGAEICVTY